jgi:hypothetical protein
VVPPAGIELAIRGFSGQTIGVPDLLPQSGPLNSVIPTRGQAGCADNCSCWCNTSKRRIDIDAGCREVRTTRGCLQFIERLEAKGWTVGGDLMWRPVTKDDHNERAWRRRETKALRFLYGAKLRHCQPHRPN